MLHFSCAKLTHLCLPPPLPLLPHRSNAVCLRCSLCLHLRLQLVRAMRALLGRGSPALTPPPELAYSPKPKAEPKTLKNFRHAGGSRVQADPGASSAGEGGGGGDDDDDSDDDDECVGVVCCPSPPPPHTHTHTRSHRLSP
jgi:hypothetical protein